MSLFNENDFEERCALIHRNLAEHPNRQREIEDQLYAMLTSHPLSDLHRKLYHHDLERFMKQHNERIVEDLMRKVPHVMGRQWLYLRSSRDPQRAPGALVYKRYYSIECRNLRDLEHVVTRFPSFVRELHEDAERMNGEPVTMKIQRNFHELFLHAHALVIHSANEQSLERIHHVVVSLARELKLPLHPTRRAHKGFDIYGDTGMSHSQLVARMTCAWLYANHDDLVRAPIDVFEHKLKRRMLDASKMDLDRLLTLSHT